MAGSLVVFATMRERGNTFTNSVGEKKFLALT